ncbi:MAG: hypothetical protein EB078_06980, partial [Proteobacteria bacterium]|nr:hypothetical protein [Pseudomonadota bacterium]NDD04632.1 hypothetical protein [Pseudomonadota bacterium]
MSGLLRLIFAVYFLAATAATSHDFHGGIPESSNTSQRIEADSPQAPSSEDLKTFLELLNQREKVLQAANASL